MQYRRGIHSLISVAMLIGFAIVTSGILLAVLVDYGDIAGNNAQCILSNVVLHDVGINRAYFVVTLHNLGSNPITAANITFIDDHDVEYGFRNSSISVAEGHSLSQMGTFPASVSIKDTFVIKSLAMADDGSTVQCSTIH